MTAPTDGQPLLCHVKDCNELATETCERCGQPCCDEHVRHLSIERRSEQQARSDALARIPTFVETYTLCIRCSTKPVQRKASLS